MPAPLADNLRALIVSDLRDTDMSINAIAKKYGVSTSTVGLLAKGMNRNETARAKTQNATQARQAGFAAKRAELAELYLELALEHARSSRVVDARFASGLMTASAIGIDKHAMLVKLDSDPNAEYSSVLQSFIAAVKAEWEGTAP